MTAGDDADVAEGLDELYRERVRRDGVGSARRWYWRQVAGFGLRWRHFTTRMDSNRYGGGGMGMGTETWRRAIGLAVRSLTRAPGLAVVAVLTLALGIGANTAIFSVIRGSLLRPLPYADPDGLLGLSDGHPNFGGGGTNQSIPNLMDLRDGSRLLSSVAMYRVLSGNLSTDDGAERVPVLYTSHEMLGTLGVAPARGRDFLAGDDLADAESALILGDAFWRSHFGGDPDVVGRAITMNARTTRIVGILPPSFTFPGDPQVVMAMQHVGAGLRRGSRGYNGIARMAPGADLEGVRAELTGIFAGLREAYPEENGDWLTQAEPLADLAAGRNARSLYLLGGAVALVLLIAVVNVANLLLVRAETRQRELAVRFSLGARRAALLSQFVSEGLVLAIIGGALGVLAALWGVDLLLALYADALPRASEVRVDAGVLGFALAVTVVVGVLVGLVPLLRVHPDRLHEVLKDGARGASHRGSTLGRVLVVGEVALAVLVVAGAGLLANSMWRLQQVDLGVADAERVMTFRMSLPGAAYDGDGAIPAFTDELGARLAALPGVEAVGFVNRLPLLGGDNTTMSVYGEPERSADFVSSRLITPGYFDAVGVPLLAGRWLGPEEYRGPTTSVVINRTLARQLFGTEEAVGRRIASFLTRDGDGLTVVGVSGDIAGGRPDRPAPPAFYYPATAALAVWGSLPASEQWFVGALVKTAGDPHGSLAAFRAAVASVDPALPIYQPATLGEIARDRLGIRRFAMSLFGVFAGLALLLGAVGIYGVMSFTVAQRAPEMGMRLALGASRGSVLRMVLAHGARMTAPGVAIGIVAALASARVLGNLLFEVSPLDPWTYGIVAAVLGLVSLGATLLPAVRATRADPLASIRSE
jgi:predicted permease